MSISKVAISQFSLLLYVMVLGVGRPSAQVLEEVIYTVGTTAIDNGGRSWGYILWQGDAPDLTLNKRYAIYAKQGAADSVNPYRRQAVTGVQQEPAVIQVILNRAANLGDDAGQLEKRIDSLFQTIIPPGTFSLAEKISIVIRGAINDPIHLGNLAILARLHPSISMCLGMAHAGMLEPGQTTFEVREFDPEKEIDRGVIGRVTVQSGVVVELPATGPPVVVPDSSAKGDLNVRIRWGTPDDLRRLSLLNYGFNVYRMTKTFAEAGNYHLTPPTPGVLLSLLGNANVRQLNQVPVLKNKEYTLGAAANLAMDSTNSFFADDNRRYEPGGLPHKNGDQYYYFVAARDVLGRIGKVSPGVLVTICDRLPPHAPTGVSVVSDYRFVGGISRQVLKVRWKQDDGKSDTVRNYYVYRWQGPDQVQLLAANPVLHRIAGPIPHVPGQEWNSYIDDGLGSPALPGDAGKTVWYTVRAEDNGACGGNLSANSGPAFGVLRDRSGPEAPGGFVNLICRRPVVTANRFRTLVDRNQDQAFAYYILFCERADDGIAWAEFYQFDHNVPSNYVGRAEFKAGERSGSVPFRIPRGSLSQNREVVFICRVGMSDGRVSNYAVNSTAGVPAVGEIRQVNFEAATVAEKFQPSPNRRGDCFGHDPVSPGGAGDSASITPIEVTILLTPGTKEYKLYRRIDQGPLSLIKQGPADFDTVSSITIPDEAMPPNAASLCYYGQLFDEHGNPSPLTLLSDECIVVGGTIPLPTPMQAGLEIRGTEASPTMNIKWFCPPYGVERFLVFVAADPQGLPASISPELSEYISSTPTVEFYTEGGTTKTNDFYAYKTARVGPAFGNGAQFEVEVNVLQGRKYTVFVKAVGVHGGLGPRSNVEAALWTPSIVTGPQVPWPARPLPPLNLFSTNLLAHRLSEHVFDGVGVMIGAIPGRTSPASERQPAVIYNDQDPMTYLFSNSKGERLFPVVMYRVQLPNAYFPQVSGDIVQVTPLMEAIAYNREVINGSTVVTVKDPFVAVASPPAGTNVPLTPLYLLDTQPIIANARYVYLLVRFNKEGEVKEVVPSSFVEVTP